LSGCFFLTSCILQVIRLQFFMASKVIYIFTTAIGITAASGAAWWFQQPKNSAEATTAPSTTQSAGKNSATAKPPSVEAIRVEVARLTDDTQAVGSLRSRRGVVLRPEVSGRITQLNFTDGQRVRKGQVLVQFDDQLAQAQIQQSQSELSIAQANHKRNQDLVAQNFVSQRSLDESAANLQVAQAKLALARATAARLKILAPFDGIAGIRQVSVGDYLKDGADIVNIEDIDAMYVDFRLPERFQAKIARGQSAQLDLDALPGRTYTAQVEAIDPLIDANGRSVGVRACIDNRRLELRPGMFARVKAMFGVRENARVIPEEAIVPQGGKLFVIKLLDGPDGNTRTTQRVEVKVGLRSPGRVEILQGLAPGDTVVTAGQQRAQRDGTVVTVVDVSANRTAEKQAARGASAPAASAAVSPVTAVSAPTAASSVAAAASRPSSPSGTQAVHPMAKTPTSPAALPGPNPCGQTVSRAPANSAPSAGAATTQPSPAHAAASHPA
jgi:membrane fusion protein (multidrug efflux system)